MNARQPSGAGAPIVPGVIIGDHFRIVRLLGEGGMGAVYLAENSNLPDMRYAIKVLLPELTSVGRYAQMLEEEARKQARLDHENVVQLFDYFRWGNRYCLVLAFVEGQSLADLIKANPNGLEERRALDLVLEILRGVNHAHEKGVWHCDIKPANVLVDARGRARVTDFGIARDIASTASTPKGLVVGTPAYMSPEQAERPDKVDHRSDVYSTGVLLFELLTGRMPFPELDATLYPQLTLDPTDIRDFRSALSPRLARIVTTALQRDPAERFQGCLDFEQAILAYRQHRRWMRTWLPALAVTAALGLVGVLVAHQRERMLQEENRQNEIRMAREAEQRQREIDAKARLTIDASISSALQQIGSLCLQSERLPQKKAALITSQKADFPDLVEKLRVQVRDIEANMADFEKGYNDALANMRQFGRPMVEERVAAHPAPDPQSAKLLRGFQRDYTALVESGQRRNAAELISGCKSG